MSLKHVELLGSRYVCVAARRWLISLGEEITTRDAWYACPNFTWLAYYQGEKKHSSRLAKEAIKRGINMPSFVETMPQDLNDAYREAVSCPFFETEGGK